MIDNLIYKVIGLIAMVLLFLFVVKQAFPEKDDVKPVLKETKANINSGKDINNGVPNNEQDVKPVIIDTIPVIPLDGVFTGGQSANKSGIERSQRAEDRTGNGQEAERDIRSISREPKYNYQESEEAKSIGSYPCYPVVEDLTGDIIEVCH